MAPICCVLFINILMHLPITSEGTKRMVGGSRVSEDKFPFLATFTFNTVQKPGGQSKKPRITCTASLIAKHWIVSATHCLGKKDHLKVGKCSPGAVAAKFRGGKWGRLAKWGNLGKLGKMGKMGMGKHGKLGKLGKRGTRGKYAKGANASGNVCKNNKHGDFEFYPGRDRPSELRMGVLDFFKEHDKRQVYHVDHIVRPKKAYPSGGYGTYGGYDIILIKTKEPILEATPICLPSPDFRDNGIKATIAGYGKTRRATCEVNSRGPSKFRYCGIEKACQEKGIKFRRADCKVQFPYKNKTLTGCQRKIPSPSSTNLLCQKFLSSSSNAAEQFQFSNWPDVDEVEIYCKENKSLVAKCYRQMDEENNGWCGVNRVNSIQEQKIDITPDAGWGFCSKECYSNKEEPMFGVAKEKMVDILSHDYCEDKLLAGGNKTYKVKPEVLCVGFNKSYNIRVYLMGNSHGSAEANYEHVRAEDKQFADIAKKEQSWYVVGPGSCYGDSGGPVLTHAIKNDTLIPVLLGVTSSGTSKIANCGGIDNPTHYTRIKKMIPWIKRYIKDSELCFTAVKEKAVPKKRPNIKPRKAKLFGSARALSPTTQSTKAPMDTNDSLTGGSSIGENEYLDNENDNDLVISTVQDEVEEEDVSTEESEDEDEDGDYRLHFRRQTHRRKSINEQTEKKEERKKKKEDEGMESGEEMDGRGGKKINQERGSEGSSTGDEESYESNESSSDTSGSRDTKEDRKDDNEEEYDESEENAENEMQYADKDQVESSAPKLQDDKLETNFIPQKFTGKYVKNKY